MNIRLVIADKWPRNVYLSTNNLNNDQFKDISQITKYVVENCDNKDKLTNSLLKIIDFTVPDDIDSNLINDICNGKAMLIWWDNSVNFYKDYYQSWIFIKKDKEYVLKQNRKD
jgi:hypothetical protein